MSMYDSLVAMGDFDDNGIFGQHMNMMHQMNSMMNSVFGGDSFMMGGFGMNGRPRGLQHSLMPFSMPIMPNMNRLLSGMDNFGGHSYVSSTVVSMTSGPDGRPHQVYKATSSTRTGPGGVKETQKTLTDTRSGTKKMAIGHHIGDRAHIVEKAQNMHTGDREEKQDFINLEEDEAEDFNREWEQKAKSRSEIPRISTGSYINHHHRHGANPGLLAITGGSSRRRQRERQPSLVANPRRSIRSSPLIAPPFVSSSPRCTRHH